MTVRRQNSKLDGSSPEPFPLLTQVPKEPPLQHMHMLGGSLAAFSRGGSLVRLIMQMANHHSCTRHPPPPLPSPPHTCVQQNFLHAQACWQQQEASHLLLLQGLQRASGCRVVRSIRLRRGGGEDAREAGGSQAGHDSTRFREVQPRLEQQQQQLHDVQPPFTFTLYGSVSWN